MKGDGRRRNSHEDLAEKEGLKKLNADRVIIAYSLSATEPALGPNGHFWVCSPRRPQWQHWGEL